MPTIERADGQPAPERLKGTGAALRDAFVAASDWLNAQAEHVNALNVFPVPDGDTGTNMSLTLQATADALRPLPDTASVAEVARAAYEAAMLGARGNSGVILSQLLKGFATALEGKRVLTPPDLATALSQAREAAYRAVSKPVEGTILTVATRAAEAAQTASRLDHDLTRVLEFAVVAAGEAVANTPNQLDVLRQAGVVDSGGEGYRVILEGAWMWSTGQSAAPPPPSATSSNHLLPRDLLGAAEDNPFGFCTEFLLRDCQTPVEDVRAAMEALGESVIAVGDADLLRVHVHTLRPGQALEYAVDHGTLAKVKVENMTLQNADFLAKQAGGAAAASTAQPAAAEIGVIAVAAGDGLLDVFRSLGAVVVQGGQTMNPSVQEILSAVEEAPFNTVIVLPNNSNIVMTANHVRELARRPVEVVPTTSVPQGIAALLALDYGASLADNAASMARAARGVQTIEVTNAVRDSQVDGVAVKAGQMVGILDGAIVAAEDTPTAALLAALEQADLSQREILTLYYGEGVLEPVAQEVARQVRALASDAAVEVVPGGQRHYPYIASLE